MMADGARGANPLFLIAGEDGFRCYARMNSLLSGNRELALTL
jgi:hypothetical protein